MLYIRTYDVNYVTLYTYLSYLRYTPLLILYTRSHHIHTLTIYIHSIIYTTGVSMDPQRLHLTHPRPARPLCIQGPE